MDVPVEQRTEELGRQLGKPVSAEYVRQLLHRARKLFADLLLKEVAQSLEHPTLEAVKQELTDLGLATFFRDRSVPGRRPPS